MKFLNKKEVAKLLGISGSTIYRLLESGEFPQPVKLSPHRVGWTEESVLDWLKTRNGGDKKQYKSNLEELDAIKAATDSAIIMLKNSIKIQDKQLLVDLRDYYFNIASILKVLVNIKEES